MKPFYCYSTKAKDYVVKMEVTVSVTEFSKAEAEREAIKSVKGWEWITVKVKEVKEH